MLPTNVFLQNVTASAYLVEVLDRSGLLEIVAQGGVAGVQQQQQDEEADSRNDKTTFRVSAVRFQPGFLLLFVRLLNAVLSWLTERNDRDRNQIQSAHKLQRMQAS